MADQTPLDVEAIRARLDAVVPAGPWEVFDNGGTTNIVGEGGDPYVAHIGNSSWPGVEDMAAFIAAAPTDLRRLLDENARLNSENERYLRIIDEITADNAGLTACLDAVLDVITPKNPDWKPLSERYPEHFTPDTPEEAARKKGWGQGVALLTQQIQHALEAAPEMPRPPAEGACPLCGYIVAEIEKGPYCTNINCPWASWLEGHPHMPRPSAQEPASGTETSGTGSGRGTGVAEASGTAQVRDAYRPEYASTLLRLIDEAQTTTPFYRRPVIVQDDIITDAGFLRDAVVAVWNSVPQLLPSLPVPSAEDS